MNSNSRGTTMIDIRQATVVGRMQRGRKGADGLVTPRCKKIGTPVAISECRTLYSCTRVHLFSHVSPTCPSLAVSCCHVTRSKRTGTPAALGSGLTSVDGESVNGRRNSYFGTWPCKPAVLPCRVMDVTASLACSNASLADGLSSLAMASKNECEKMRAAPSSTKVLQQTTVWTPASRMA